MHVTAQLILLTQSSLINVIDFHLSKSIMALNDLAQPSSVLLPSDEYQKKLLDAVADNTFNTQLEEAIVHVMNKIPQVALGKSCGLARAEVIKTTCVGMDDSLMVSGTLSQLNLREKAINSLDVGTLKMVMEEATSVPRLAELIGPITINVDTWTTSELTNLVRGDKDGYVHGLCLIILWSAEDDAISAALTALATDLTFKFRKLGRGGELLLLCVWYRCGDLGSPWHD